MQKKTTENTPDAALKALRRQITLVSALLSGLILLLVIIIASYLMETQLKNSAAKYLQGSLNSIITKLQVESVVSDTWLRQIEASERMIVHVRDGKMPLQFQGAWQPETNRNTLIQRAEEQVEKQGVKLDIRPISATDILTEQFVVNGDYGDYYLGAAAVLSNNDGWQTIIVLHDQTFNQKKMWIFRGIFVMLLLSTIGLLLWLCWLLAGRTIRPIVESRKKQAEFIAAASHELRSPLAVIAASASALNVSQTQDIVLNTTIQRECRRMSRLVDDLLTLARSDAGTWSVSMKPVDVDTLLLEMTEKFLPIVKQKKQTLELQVPDTALPTINGDKQRLEQLLTILLDNAYSYTPDGGRIVLYADSDKSKVILKVVDNGPGIPKESQKHIFDRFYRGDTSRTQKQHCGLGLSIAKELASLHKGRLYLENVAQGASFVLEFPRK